MSSLISKVEAMWVPWGSISALLRSLHQCYFWSRFIIYKGLPYKNSKYQLTIQKKTNKMRQKDSISNQFWKNFKQFYCWAILSQMIFCQKNFRYLVLSINIDNCKNVSNSNTRKSKVGSLVICSFMELSHAIKPFVLSDKLFISSSADVDNIKFFGTHS